MKIYDTGIGDYTFSFGLRNCMWEGEIYRNGIKVKEICECTVKDFHKELSKFLWDSKLIRDFWDFLRIVGMEGKK